VSADPFAALGLPARPDLTDDDIRAAWRRIAAATHPDRADGGDPARFAAAAAAYTELRTRYGRGEAYADLTTRPGPARPAPGRQTAAPPRDTAAPHRDTPAGPGTTRHPETTPGRPSATHPETAAPRRETAAHRETLAALAARVRRGRPALLALRIAIAAAITAAAFAVAGAQPAAGGLATGALTWLLLTARHDLAPPGS
jgi:curved DNA-binding protein CbpA